MDESMSEINALPVQHPLPGGAVSLKGRPADPKLWNAARQFEEVFMSQFVKAMRATEGGEKLTQEAAGRETYDAMFSEAIAKSMVESGSLGLAQGIYRDLGGTFEAARREE